MDDESSRKWTLQVSSVQKDLTSLQAICSLRSRELQDHKSKNPSANAGVFSVSDGGPRRNRTGLRMPNSIQPTYTEPIPSSKQLMLLACKK